METLEGREMQSKNDAKPWTCDDTRANMQEYLDETLLGPVATRLFLHVRDCDACRKELDETKALFGMLDAMPAIEPPADFDEKILASVPYEAYREMAELRAPRMPVILEEESLPSVVRSGATRAAGLVLAAVATAAMAAGRVPDVAVAAVGLGLLPEALVRVQQLSRRIYVGAFQRNENV
jgi:anti-sigma factor RsiW